MIQYLYLGRVDYAEALRLQEELVALRPRAASATCCCCSSIRPC